MLNHASFRDPAFDADAIYMEAVMSPNLPSTLSLATTRKYLNEIVASETTIFEVRKFGRSKLYGYKKVDLSCLPAPRG